MPELHSDAWIEALDAAASDVAGTDETVFVIQQVVTGGNEGQDEEVAAWHVVLSPEGVRVHPGRAGAADVTFTQDRATAAAIAAGDLAAGTALARGDLRVQGATAELTRHREVLADLDRAWAGLAG